MKYVSLVALAVAATAVGWVIGCLVFVVTVTRIVFSEAFD